MILGIFTTAKENNKFFNLLIIRSLIYLCRGFVVYVKVICIGTISFIYLSIS